MNVIIVGCGKLGSSLALELARRRHSPTVVHIDPRAFRRLGPDFPGRTVPGPGFDRVILESAGIARVDSVVSTAGSDDVNALVGRIARSRYRVPQVIARLHDPRQAQLYRSLGVHSVSTVIWGGHQDLRDAEFSPVRHTADDG